MAYITDQEWADYKTIIDGAHHDFNQEDLTWFRKKPKLDRYSEGVKEYDEIHLKCLIQYNVFKAWPMNKETNTGVLDEQNISIYLNNTYLRGLGYLDANDNFTYDPGEDYFVCKGYRYRESGVTQAAQTKTEPLLTLLVLKRTPMNTNETKY